MIHADTDGLLDRCHCGAVAGFEESHTEAMEQRVRCTECCEQTNWFPTADGASCDWNLARRAEKEKKVNMWKTFYFESNQFFDNIKDMTDWRRLRAAYPRMTDDQLLDAKEATYGGHRPQAERDARPNYGFRHEHDGQRTLRDFFKVNGMSLTKGDGE